MPFDRSETLVSPSGATLSLRRTEPDGAACGVVHVLHGLAEHAARYGRFAAALAAGGFATYAHDHRGHGQTTAPGATLGRFASEDGVGRLLRDIEAVRDRIAADHPGLPVILFGHSMGAIVALNALMAGSERLAGAAIWNVNVSPGLLGRLARLLLAWERVRLGVDVPSRLLPRLTFQDWNRRIEGARTDFDWLSRDADEVRAYIDDPLCGWNASVSMWIDIFSMVFRAADDRSFAAVRRSFPMQLVGGGADPSTLGGQSVRELSHRLARMGFSNLETTVWPQTRHESLNELNRDAITKAFLGWANRIVASPRARS